jgi:Domain of unknown function (DUF1906)/Hemopexin
MEALLGQGLFVSSPLPSETICIDIRHDAMSKFYFFHGDKYCRYDAKADSVDADYLPAYASITDNWSGLPTGVDAALNWGNGKTFFFVASEYYRYDNGNDSVLRWCGFYLAPAPSQVLGVGWMNGNIQPIVTKLPLLQHIGWKIAPIYVGQQQPDLAGMSHHGNAAQGALDAGHAATLATAAGFPAGTILYLDIEKSPTQLESGMRDYYTSWVETIPALGSVLPFSIRSDIAQSQSSARVLGCQWDKIPGWPRRDLLGPALPGAGAAVDDGPVRLRLATGRGRSSDPRKPDDLPLGLRQL